MVKLERFKRALATDFEFNNLRELRVMFLEEGSCKINEGDDSCTEQCLLNFLLRLVCFGVNQVKPPIEAGSRSKDDENLAGSMYLIF